MQNEVYIFFFFVHDKEKENERKSERKKCRSIMIECRGSVFELFWFSRDYSKKQSSHFSPENKLSFFFFSRSICLLADRYLLPNGKKEERNRCVNKDKNECLRRRKAPFFLPS